MGVHNFFKRGVVQVHAIVRSRVRFDGLNQRCHLQPAFATALVQRFRRSGWLVSEDETQAGVAYSSHFLF